MFALFPLVFAPMVLGSRLGLGVIDRTQPPSKFDMRSVESVPRSLMSDKRDEYYIAPSAIRLQRRSPRSSRNLWHRPRQKGLGDTVFHSTNVNRTNLVMKYLGEIQYSGVIQIGNESFEVIIDTGSSDTWIVHQDFLCVDYSRTPVESDDCRFGKPHRGPFQRDVENTTSFSIVYGDGEFISGPPGYANVTVAGITVQKQQVSFVDMANWDGDGITSGVLGLAYPILTKAFNSTLPSHHAPGSPYHRIYDPVFTRMYKQGLVTPIFSMAMDRSNMTGWLALGGLPPVSFRDDFAVTPIKMHNFYNITSLATEYSFYAVQPDSVILKTRNLTDWVMPTNYTAIVDSGTTFTYLPSYVASAYAAQFSPKAEYDPFTGQYWVPCNSTVPPFGIVVTGKPFFLSPEDLLQDVIKLDWNGDGVLYCTIGIADALSGPEVLGEVFMNNVVSVFDVGKGEMRFAARM